ncbi:MAG: hypothetical protein WA460_10210 [Nitrososphaeraceae archaeon]
MYFDTLLQQTFSLEATRVFIPLGFGVAVGLAYAIISSAWLRRRK